MRDGAPVAIAISEESGRRVELHDDRVKRAFRAFDDYDVKEIVADGGDETYWLTSSKNLYGERVIHESRDCLSSRDPSLIREATANEIEAFRPCSVCAVDREYRGGSNETHECPFCGDEDIGQLPTHMRACDGDSEGVDRGEGVETDGGHRHDTDRVDGTLIAECPNATAADDDHLQIEVNYERVADADELVAKVRETWPDCGECGATLQCVETREPSEIMTDGGQNTYLDSREEWFLIGLVENALSRRDEERWGACRRLVQQLLARLDRGTRAHRLVRDGCCSSHPSSSQWRDSLERAKTALEVRGR